MNGQSRGGAHPLLFLITAFLIANLVATGWLAYRLLQHESNSSAAQARSLPQSLTASMREDLFRTFQRYFNAGDYDAIYGMFHGLGKMQILKQKVVDNLSNLRKKFGSIRDGAYSHFEIRGLFRRYGELNLRDHYNLYYKLIFDSNKAGSLTIGIFRYGQEYGINQGETYGVFRFSLTQEDQP